jgi:hypothetical protein
MDASTKSAVDALHADLQAVFGQRLQSLVVYGVHAKQTVVAASTELVNTLALVDAVTFHDLTACARYGAKWAKRRLAVPLLLGADEFRRSLDAFPLEYGDIIGHHIVIMGAEPFRDANVKLEDLRRGCELQAKSHLIHLREGFIEAGGDARAVSRLIAASARPFTALLANVLRLQGVEPATPDQIASFAETSLGLPAAVVTRVVNADGKPPGDAMTFYRDYLGAVERLWNLVDEWRGAR